MNIAKKKEEIPTLLLILGIAGFLALIAITNIYHFNYMMNADIASDAILGKLIWDSKEIIPSTWYIAAETRIICTPNVMALFNGLTHNMVLSAALACCTMTVLILWSAFYFGRMIRFRRKEKLLFGFLCLMLPADFSILELFYLFVSYYAVHVVVLLFTFGTYLEALSEKSVKWKKMAVGVLLSLLLGMQGARGILVIYGPLFGMEVIRNLYRMYCRKEKEKTDIFIALWTVVLLAAGFAGMLFPFSTGQEFSRNIRNGFHKLWSVVIPDMIKAVGLGSSQHVLGKICVALLLIIAVYLVADILYRMCRRKEIETAEWGFLIMCSSPVVSALMLAFTTVESTERYYFQFICVMAYAAVLFFRKMKITAVPWQGMRLGVCLVISLLTIERFCNIYLPILKAEDPKRGEDYDVVCFLEENGFQTAYSTFENANKMTVLANGKVRVFSVASVENMDICKWMSSTDWYVPNLPFEEKTAYIIPDSQMEAFAVFLSQHMDDMRLETQIGRFYIYSSDYNFSCLGNG